MVTAMEMLKHTQKERDARIFEHMIQAFLTRYKPTRDHDAIEFERDLHMLVRQIYQDAQAPLLDHISKILMSMPMPLNLPKDVP